MLEKNQASADTQLAMGCLVGRLEQKQRDLKRLLVDDVRSFVSPANRARLGELVR
jgi:hypothetical protein